MRKLPNHSRLVVPTSFFNTGGFGQEKTTQHRLMSIPLSNASPQKIIRLLQQV
jgi:hypothetical protein